MARAHGQVFQVRGLEGTPALVAVQSLRGAGEPLRELILHGAAGLGAEPGGKASWKMSHSARLLAGLRALAGQVTCGQASANPSLSHYCGAWGPVLRGHS